MYRITGDKIKLIIFFIALALPPIQFLNVAKAVSAPADQALSIPQIPIFKIPQKLNFCDYKLPLHERHCREMLDRELTIAVYNRAQVIMWLKRKPRYFPLFTKEIKTLKLPDDLKFVAVAESSLIEDINSHAGAAGLWQFMRHTGRRNGLRISADIDERLDPFTATRCALNYLKFLKNKFNSWPLALAAYNCGENRVSRAIKEQKTSNYHTLSLPKESERYLYRLAAIKLILSNPADYGYKIAPRQCYKPLETEQIRLSLNNKFSFVDFALQLGTTYHKLSNLNPHIINKKLPMGNFNLTLPKGCKPKIAKVLKNLTPLSSIRRYYTVKKGDTLGAISRRFHIPNARLRSLNQLNSSTIRIGQKLRLR